MDSKVISNLWIALRITMGSIFLWAFFDKVFGLGFATKPEAAWLTGASPTSGFLTHATHGVFAPIFQSMAGNPVTDWLFMMGLLGVGVAMTLGVGMKIASYSGSLMMLFIYLSAFPPKNHPIFDEHIVYIFILLIIPHVVSAKKFSFSCWWTDQDIVKRYPILQ